MYVCIYIYIYIYTVVARTIEQGATHVSGLPASLTEAAAKERMRVGTSRPLAALAVSHTQETGRQPWSVQWGGSPRNAITSSSSSGVALPLASLMARRKNCLDSTVNYVLYNIEHQMCRTTVSFVVNIYYHI